MEKLVLPPAKASETRRIPPWPVKALILGGCQFHPSSKSKPIDFILPWLMEVEL